MILSALYFLGLGIAIGGNVADIVNGVRKWRRSKRHAQQDPMVVTHRVIRGWQEPAVKGFLRGDR